MLPKFTTNSSKVVSLGDWEKGSCNVAPYDAEAIYRPLEVLTEEKRKQKALGLCDAFLVILLFLTVGYILMVNLGDPAVLTNEKTLSIEIIGKQNTTITPIYYSMIKGDNTRVKVALELSSPMIIDTQGTVFQVRNFTSKSPEIVPTLIWFPPTPSTIYWAMEYVHVNGYLDNDYNVFVEPITVDYSCEVSPTEDGPWEKIRFNRTYNVDTSNFSYHTLDDSREPAPWDSEEEEDKETEKVEESDEQSGDEDVGYPDVDEEEEETATLPTEEDNEKTEEDEQAGIEEETEEDEEDENDEMEEKEEDDDSDFGDSDEFSNTD